MKKGFLILLLCLSVFTLATQKIRIGVTPIPFVDILEFIRPDLETSGIELDVVVFNDYVLPNISLAGGELDANFFQHGQYLKSFTEKRGIKGLVPSINVLIAPMAFYLKKPYSELKKGDKIALPNDPTNEGRALLLLHNNGVITLKKPDKVDSTVKDIGINKKELKFMEMEAGFVPRVYKEDDSFAGAVINTNYALSIGLSSQKDATFAEGKDSPFANYIVIRKEAENENWVKILSDVITSDKVRDFIIEKFEGTIVPTF